MTSPPWKANANQQDDGATANSMEDALTYTLGGNRRELVRDRQEDRSNH